MPEKASARSQVGPPLEAWSVGEPPSMVRPSSNGLESTDEDTSTSVSRVEARHELPRVVVEPRP